MTRSVPWLRREKIPTSRVSVAMENWAKIMKGRRPMGSLMMKAPAITPRNWETPVMMEPTVGEMWRALKILVE